jgi:Asp-tRNA(Asn)/Glu-tRNA(Gln) amidotransferase A subunit family amidase
VSDGFRIEEATIGGTHRAIRRGEATCRNLVEGYLARIEAYDRAGPGLGSIINVHPSAIEEAEELDRAFSSTGRLVGPLHGITLLVKDQIQTAGVPTTFGSIAFESYRAQEEATIITRLRNAGAIVLAKTLLADFALSWFAFSSVGGETKNPYALDRDPGGSSGGTGAGVAANLGAVGIGEDTGGSIRVPSSFNNLVGIRVTTGLISRAGMQPLVVQDDTAGPMTRTVLDAAALLDVLVGYDPADPLTSVTVQADDRGGYARFAREDAVVGKRLGILRHTFGRPGDPASEPVTQVIRSAIADLEALGAEVIEPKIAADLDELIEYTTLVLMQTRTDLDRFLRDLPDAPARSLEELYATGSYHELIDLIPQLAQGPVEPEEDPNYYRRIATRETLRRILLDTMASERLDAFVYPTVAVLPPRKDDLREGAWSAMGFPANTRLAAHVDLPAICLPAGMTSDGVPVGIELMGSPFQEASLIGLGYAFERATQHRRPPACAPPIL